jgi:hypothetical protein
MTDREWCWFCIGSGQAFLLAALFSFIHSGEPAGGHAFGFAIVGVAGLLVGVILMRRSTGRKL